MSRSRLSRTACRFRAKSSFWELRRLIECPQRSKNIRRVPQHSQDRVWWCLDGLQAPKHSKRILAQIWSKSDPVADFVGALCADIVLLLSVNNACFPLESRVKYDHHFSRSNSWFFMLKNQRSLFSRVHFEFGCWLRKSRFWVENWVSEARNKI